MLDIVLSLVLGFVIGWRINQFLQLIAFKRILQELGISEVDMRRLAKKNGIELPDEPRDPEPAAPGPQPVIEIRIEQHQGQLFAWRLDTDQFLAQGQDSEGLQQILQERFRDSRIVVRRDQGGDLLQKNNA